MKAAAAANEERRQRVWELALDGWNCQQIGDLIGCHRSTVSRDLDVVSKRMQAEMERRYVQVSAQHMIRLERVYALSWSGAQQETGRTQAALLREARAALADIREMLGLNAVQQHRVEHAGTVASTLTVDAAIRIIRSEQQTIQADDRG